MTEIDVLFKYRKIKTKHLLPFGFSKNKNVYTYSAGLVDEQLEMTVTVTKDGNVSAEVFDNGSKEIYVLHRISSAKGAFAGRVREEYLAVLEAISNACFEPDVFKSEEAKQIIRYVGEKYQDELQYLWKRFPDNAIFRRQDNAKWYAALLTVQKEKLGLSESGSVEIIDLRGRPEYIETLIDGAHYFPGYHMNKKHWFTICLNGTISTDEIFRRIDESFALAVK